MTKIKFKDGVKRKGAPRHPHQCMLSTSTCIVMDSLFKRYVKIDLCYAAAMPLNWWGGLLWACLNGEGGGREGVRKRWEVSESFFMCVLVRG